MPSLKSIKISYSSPPLPPPPQPAPPCEEPPPPPFLTPPPPPPSPHPPCTPCQHKNHHPPPPPPPLLPPPPGAPPPLPPPLPSPPPPLLPPPPGAPPPPPPHAALPPLPFPTKSLPHPSPTSPAASPTWRYSAPAVLAPSPSIAPPPGSDNATVAFAISGLFLLCLLTFGLNFLAKTKLMPKGFTAPSGGNHNQLGMDKPVDEENPESSVRPPDKQTAPTPNEGPTTQPQKEPEDDNRNRKSKSSDNGVIQMLLGMRATLLKMKELENQELMAADRPTTSSAGDGEKENDQRINDEEKETEPNFKQESTADKSEAESHSLPQNKEEKNLEDSPAVVKGRGKSEKIRSRKRGSNLPPRQRDAMLGALNAAEKSDLFVEEADTIEEAEEDEDEEEEEVEEKNLEETEEKQMGERDAFPEKEETAKTGERSAASPSNCSAQSGDATRNDAGEDGVFMEKEMKERDDQEEGRDEEGKNVSRNSQSKLRRNDGRKKAQSAEKNESNESNRRSTSVASANQKVLKTAMKGWTKSSDKTEDQESVPDGGGDNIVTVEDKNSEVVETWKGMDLSEGMNLLEKMDDPMGFVNGLGSENWNEVKKLVAETSVLLQELMRMKGRKHRSSTTALVKLGGEFVEHEGMEGDDEEDQNLPEGQALVNDDVGGENQGFPQESKEEMVNDDNTVGQAQRNVVQEVKQQQTTTGESGKIWSGEKKTTPAKGKEKHERPISMKPGKLDPTHLPKSHLDEAMRQKMNFGPLDFQEIGEFEDKEVVIDEDVTKELEQEAEADESCLGGPGLDENEGMESDKVNTIVNFDSLLEENDAPNRPMSKNVKVRKHDLSGLDYQDLLQEEKVDKSEEKRSAEEMIPINLESTLKGSEEFKNPVTSTRHVGRHDSNQTQSQKSKAKRPIASSSTLITAMESEVFENEGMVKDNDSMEEYQNVPQEYEEGAKTDDNFLQDYKNVAGMDESDAMKFLEEKTPLNFESSSLKANRTTAGKKDRSRSTYTQLQQDTASSTLVNLAMGSGVFEEQQEMVKAGQARYEALLKAGDDRKKALPQPQLRQPKAEGPSMSSAFNTVTQTDVFEKLNYDDDEVMRSVESKREVAAKQHPLPKTRLQLHDKAKRQTSSSVESGEFKKQMDQELPPCIANRNDDVDADAADVEEEEEKEEVEEMEEEEKEEEESATA